MIFGAATGSFFKGRHHPRIGFENFAFLQWLTDIMGECYANMEEKWQFRVAACHPCYQGNKGSGNNTSVAHMTRNYSLLWASMPEPPWNTDGGNSISCKNICIVWGSIETICNSFYREIIEATNRNLHFPKAFSILRYKHAYITCQSLLWMGKTSLQLCNVTNTVMIPEMFALCFHW